MSADLIVMVFEGESGAKNAQNATQSMRAGLTSGLAAAVLISSSNEGQITFDPAEMPPVEENETTKLLTKMFAQALFGESSEPGLQQLTDAGLDKDFLSEVGDILKPDSSALLVFLPEDSPVDKRRLIYIMSLLEGEIFHTSFPATVETALLEEVEIKQED